MQFPIRVGLHRSFLLCGLVTLGYGLAIGVCLATPWIWPIRLAVVALALAGWVHGIHQAGRQRAELILRADGSLLLTSDASVPPVAGHVTPGGWIHPLLTVFSVLDTSGRYRRVIVLPDALDAESFRRLRVWLRHAVKPAADDEV